VDILKPDIVISNDGALARYNGELISDLEVSIDTTNLLIKELLQYESNTDIVVSTRKNINNLFNLKR